MTLNFSTRAFLLFVAAFTLLACQPSTGNSQSAGSGMPGTAAMSEEITELQTIDTQEGEGALAEQGKNIVVHYTGWLYDAEQEGNKGNKFDSSLDRNQPFAFPLGSGRVIRGWDEGFAGMKVGGKRTLIIPPDMGYGARGAGAAIPPNSTLLFEVELLDVR